MNQNTDLGKLTIKVCVACMNAEGAPEFVWTKIECTQEQSESGDHYKMAKKYAEEQGYDAEFAFDENDVAAKQSHDMSVFFAGVPANNDQYHVVNGEDFRVVWEIDIIAPSPRQAAEQALAIQRDCHSSSTVFDVFDSAGELHRIDLEDSANG